MTPLQSARAKLGTTNWLNLVAGLLAIFCYRTTTFSLSRFEASWEILDKAEKLAALSWAQHLYPTAENSPNYWTPEALEHNHYLALENL